jgi:hypothetical protein
MIVHIEKFLIANKSLFTLNETQPFSLFAADESSGLASNNVFDVSADLTSNT